MDIMIQLLKDGIAIGIAMIQWTWIMIKGIGAIILNLIIH